MGGDRGAHGLGNYVDSIGGDKGGHGSYLSTALVGTGGPTGQALLSTALVGTRGRPCILTAICSVNLLLGLYNDLSKLGALIMAFSSWVPFILTFPSWVPYCPATVCSEVIVPPNAKGAFRRDQVSTNEGPTADQSHEEMGFSARWRGTRRCTVYCILQRGGNVCCLPPEACRLTCSAIRRGHPAPAEVGCQRRCFGSVHPNVPPEVGVCPLT